MPNWESYLKQDTLKWLLEQNNPSVRYLTLIDLMDKKPNSKEVKAARSKIMTEGPVPKILSKQTLGGYWGEDPSRFYLPKYKATVWSFSILAELAADGNDERIKKTREYILKHSQHEESGSFSPYTYEYMLERFPQRKGEWSLHKSDINSGSSVVIPCLTGNMLCGLIRFGYLEDPRVQKGINWIVKYLRFDDGVEKAPTGWPYNVGSRKGDGCWGKHTCHTGVMFGLKALSEIPRTKQSRGVKDTVKHASEYFLKHHIYRRSHDLSQISIPSWIKAGFPPSGFLELLLILSKMGYKDDRMQDAIDLLTSKQNKSGRWIMEQSLNGRMHANIEQKGEESKWITLYALKVLKNFYS